MNAFNRIKIVMCNGLLHFLENLTKKFEKTLDITQCIV
jgi:hypothetical protein